MTERSREADAFITTIEQTAPQTVSACDGWTTHEIAAHVTGIAVEVGRLSCHSRTTGFPAGPPLAPL